MISFIATKPLKGKSMENLQNIQKMFFENLYANKLQSKENDSDNFNSNRARFMK